MQFKEGWHPVAASHDLPEGHVYQTALFDGSLAVWRAKTGQVNIWEDRCPHRGVRFSVGTALAYELRCQYHAWRFASGSGACIAVPAQPDRTPPQSIRAKVFPAVECGGLVWTQLVANGSDPPTPRPGTVLRAMPVWRSAEFVDAALAALKNEDASYFVQPVASDRSVIRGIVHVDGSLAEHDADLERLRRALEASH